MRTGVFLVMIFALQSPPAASNSVVRNGLCVPNIGTAACSGERSWS
jgi:hypothetical protein